VTLRNVTRSAFFDELAKIGAARIKSNDRMPARTKANVNAMMAAVHSLDEEHRKPAMAFARKVTPEGLFDILHSMRRWYSGQTMARKLVEHQDSLSSAMKLSPEDVVGIYRGFKVPKDDPLAKVEVGQTLTLPVTRNHGVSSWSTTEAPTNRFSGGGDGKVGLIVKLVDGAGTKPILAPPSHTEPWFNALYAHAIGKSFRPKEGEYLIAAPSVKVEVVRVKK
jgi:hypothetical protein